MKTKYWQCQNSLDSLRINTRSEGEDREGWVISTTCAILYRFIPVIKLGIGEREGEEEEKRRKGKERKARANLGKKERK